MFKKSIIWTNFADSKTIYEMFKDYGIRKNVKKFKKITYVRFDEDGDCFYRWTPQTTTVEVERIAYRQWIESGYTELKMFNGDKEYVGTI